MWKLNESHKWVTIPHTVYERRRELRVRESRHTLMFFDRKYYNVETGKYEREKLPIIHSETLYNIIDDMGHKRIEAYYYPTKLNKRLYNDDIGVFKFTPKDDDFDN